MSFGQSSFNFTNNVNPNSVPVLALDNGLHLDGSTGKLGGSLIENTEIDTIGFQFAINSPFNSDYAFVVDEPSGLIYLGNYSGPFAAKPKLIIDNFGLTMNIGFDTPPFNSEFSFDGNTGDLTGTANGSLNLTGTTVARLLTGGSGGFQAFGNFATMGDVGGANNKTAFQVDDTSKIFTMVSGAVTPKDFFAIDATNFTAKFGDISGASLGGVLNIDIANTNFSFKNATGGLESIIAGNNFNCTYDINDVFSKNYFHLDTNNSNAIMTMGDTSGVHWHMVNGASNVIGRYFEILNNADQFFKVNLDTGETTIRSMSKATRNAIGAPVGGALVMVTGEAGGEYLSWYNSVTPGWVKVSSVAD